MSLPCDNHAPLQSDQPAQLEVRAAGEHPIRVTLKPVSFQRDATAGSVELPARKLVVELRPEGKSTVIEYDGHRAEVAF